MQWEVDDRSATLWARAYVLGMRLNRDKQAFEGADHTRRIALERQASGDHGPTLLTSALLATTRTTRSGMTVWTARPRRGRVRARVLYLHGGGYVHPLTADSWRLVRALCRAGAEVVVPAYPLAPGATVDDVLPRLLEVEQATCRVDPLPTVFMGDSAGGALALVLAQRLRDLDRDLPDSVVALCPWLDATLSEDDVSSLEPTDPMLATSGLRAAGQWWSGDRSPEDPLVSPVYGDLTGLPPTTVVIGDRDILRPAVDELARRAEPAVTDLQVWEVTAMFHVWMTRALPEARRMRQRLAGLVRNAAAPRAAS